MMLRIPVSLPLVRPGQRWVSKALNVARRIVWVTPAEACWIFVGSDVLSPTPSITDRTTLEKWLRRYYVLEVPPCSASR